ncbi:MAG TPA: MBL fold metallo-hydrolase [Isosphaeraceae bacterium]|jgi:phosphoribosyl 1,2-cyclic phosphodiesterase|nr:MBL fold metallo-hydrolase [Isosphaeraceae bacterium]
MAVRFAVLASGSGGNAAVVEAGGAGVLIDLGLGPRALAKRLASVGGSWETLGAAVLTHTHGDHVRDATLAEMARRGVALYCHEGHRRTLGWSAGFATLDRGGLVRHYDERPFLLPTGARVEPVELSHDGGPTFGFRVEAAASRRGRASAIGYVADTGCWSEPMADALADVDLLGVEFNHDVPMQLRSGRSPHLIRRNLGDGGHLSNEQGAGLVAAVLGRSRPGTVKHVVLLHLSRQCNRPALALKVARGALLEAGWRSTVHAAEQHAATPDVSVVAARRRASARSKSTTAAAGGFPWEV